MGKTDNVFGKAVLTGPMRIIYEHLFQKDTGGQFSSEKYDLTGMIDPELFKTHPKWIKFQEEVDAVIAEAGFNPDKAMRPWADGDDINGDMWNGMLRIKMKSKNRPDVVLDDPNQSAEQEDVQKGMYCRAEVTPMSYAMGANKGVTLLFSNVQVFANKEFEPISGGQKAASAFADDEDNF